MPRGRCRQIKSRSRQKPAAHDRPSSPPSPPPPQQRYYASLEDVTSAYCQKLPTDAPSAKSLIGEDERSEIKFHAALPKKKAAKHACARERARYFVGLTKARRRFIVRLILINITVSEGAGRRKAHCISENTLDEVRTTCGKEKYNKKRYNGAKLCTRV